MVGGGTERVIAVLANYFVKQDAKVTILLTADSRVDYNLDTRIELIQISESTGGKFLGRLQRLQKLRQYFCKHKDVAFLSFGTETNMFAILASAFLKINLVLSERNDPNQCEFARLRSMFYFFGKKFVFQTEDAKNYFSNRIRKRGIVIGNPITENLPNRYEGERRKVIAAVGRLDANKNHELLIRAFEPFIEEFPEYCLYIYGKGELEGYLNDLIAQKNLMQSVKLQGFQENVLETIRDCAMYVLCSNSEGMPNSLMEAMAIGVPSIATDCPIGGAKMLIDDYENGILVPVGDVMALVTALKELADKPQLARKLSVESSKIKEDYSVEKIGEMWLEVVKCE